MGYTFLSRLMWSQVAGWFILAVRPGG